MCIPSAGTSNHVERHLERGRLGLGQQAHVFVAGLIRDFDVQSRRVSIEWADFAYELASVVWVAAWLLGLAHESLVLGFPLTLLEFRSHGGHRVSPAVDEAEAIGTARVAHQTEQVFG